MPSTTALHCMVSFMPYLPLKFTTVEFITAVYACVCIGGMVDRTLGASVTLSSPVGVSCHGDEQEHGSEYMKQQGDSYMVDSEKKQQDDTLESGIWGTHVSPHDRGIDRSLNEPLLPLRHHSADNTNTRKDTGAGYTSTVSCNKTLSLGQRLQYMFIYMMLYMRIMEITIDNTEVMH